MSSLPTQIVLAPIEGAVAETRNWTEETTWPFVYQPSLGLDGNRLNWAFHLANQRIRTEVEAALRREESRGAHYRADFPALDPDWRRRIVFGPRAQAGAPAERPRRLALYRDVLALAGAPGLLRHDRAGRH